MPDPSIPKCQGKLDPSLPLVQSAFPERWLNPFMALLERQSECCRNTDGSCPLKGSCCVPVTTGPRLVAISIIQLYLNWALGKPESRCQVLSRFPSDMLLHTVRALLVKYYTQLFLDLIHKAKASQG